MARMTDQSPTNPSDQGDQRPTTGEATNQPPTDPLTVPVWVSLEEAAAVLGITVNAVRQRIKRGTLTATKTVDGWRVDVLDRGPTIPTAATDQPTNHLSDQRPPPTNHGDHRGRTDRPADHPSVDRAPLAQVIERRTAENARLTEAATFWQLRATQAETQLKQLTAGDDERVTESAMPPPEPMPSFGPSEPAPQAAPSEPPSLWRRVRQWLSGT